MNLPIHSRVLSALLVLCVALLWNALPAQESHPPHWSYEGNEGPQHWGQLDPAYAVCAAGHGQSPINIADATPAELPPRNFNYKPAALSIIDSGHTIQVNYAPGSSLTVGNKSYMLKQFHFHHPSEEHRERIERRLRPWNTSGLVAWVPNGRWEECFLCLLPLKRIKEI